MIGVQKNLLGAIGAIAFSASILLSMTDPAQATCSTCGRYQTALENEFQIHETWMVNEWWGEYVEPALKKLADEVRNAKMFEVASFGAFMDAQNELGTLRALQELSTNTMKNYTVSQTICEFGTLSRSLAASESKGRTTQLGLSERSKDRQLGQINSAAAQGPQADRAARLTQFKKDYCDPIDFGSAMRVLCLGGALDTRQNIDINYTRGVDAKRSLNVDFTDGITTPDEQDVMALANNLYAHQVFNRISIDKLADNEATDLQSTYLDQRSIVAKRSVAENSFNAIVGDKSAGTVQSRVYLLQVLKNLGLNDEDAARYVGDTPSYDAQMEVLTKKLYQDPAFYASLMESPANVSRQYTALQSFGLMQKRDIFETITRSEMLLSMLLEIEVSKYQDDIQNRQNSK